MLAHECLRPRVEVVDEDHGVVPEGLGGEDLPERHQVGVGELAPLVHQHHALGVDQAVVVDAPEADVDPRLHVGGLVDRSDVAESGGLGVRGGRGRLQRTEAGEVVHLAGQAGGGLWIGLEEI